MADCIFCKIAAGEIPSHKVYEDETCIAILDVCPVAKGHTLIIPKKHAENLFALSEEEASEIMKRVHHVAGQLKERLHPDGLNLVQNNGEAAGQTVMHFHMHAIPRFANDDVKINWHMPQADQEVLSALCKEITA
ncbi:MAG: HIT family protein [Lachnospiraceae bacterium]|nr:HIT family protein [Lachnospiraceae bacterium]